MTRALSEIRVVGSKTAGQGGAGWQAGLQRIKTMAGSTGSVVALPTGDAAAVEFEADGGSCTEVAPPAATAGLPWDDSQTGAAAAVAASDSKVLEDDSSSSTQSAGVDAQPGGLPGELEATIVSAPHQWGVGNSRQAVWAVFAVLLFVAGVVLVILGAEQFWTNSLASFASVSRVGGWVGGWILGCGCL